MNFRKFWKKNEISQIKKNEIWKKNLKFGQFWKNEISKTLKKIEISII